MDITVVIAYLFGLIFLYFMTRLLLIPLKVIVRLLINGIIGGVMLVVFNLIGGFWGLYLAINPVTALIAGFLGLPGVFLLTALRYLLLN